MVCKILWLKVNLLAFLSGDIVLRNVTINQHVRRQLWIENELKNLPRKFNASQLLNDQSVNFFLISKNNHRFIVHNVIGQTACYYFCHMTCSIGINSTCEAKRITTLGRARWQLSRLCIYKKIHNLTLSLVQNYKNCCPVPSRPCDLCICEVWICFIQRFMWICICKNIHYLSFPMGLCRTKCCPVPSTSCDLSTCNVWSCYVQQFKRRYIYKKIHYLTFVLDLGIMVIRNVVQYPLNHVTYALTKMKLLRPTV